MATTKSEQMDKMVLDLLDKVKQRKAEIKKAQKPVWKTTCTFAYTDSASIHDRIMFSAVNRPEKLVEMYTFLLAKEEQWKAATKELGLDVPPTWQGSPIGDWKEDLKSRAAQLTLDQKKKELESLEKRLDGLITVEQRRELELSAIAKELEG